MPINAVECILTKNSCIHVDSLFLIPEFLSKVTDTTAHWLLIPKFWLKFAKRVIYVRKNFTFWMSYTCYNWDKNYSFLSYKSVSENRMKEDSINWEKYYLLQMVFQDCAFGFW